MRFLEREQVAVYLQPSSRQYSVPPGQVVAAGCTLSRWSWRALAERRLIGRRRSAAKEMMFVSGEHDARSSAASRYAVEAGPANPNARRQHDGLNRQTLERLQCFYVRHLRIAHRMPQVVILL